MVENRRSRAIPVAMAALLLAPASAGASESQCPASEPLHYEGFSPPWNVPDSGSGGQTILSLDAELGRHYRRMTMEFDFTIDDFDAASEYVPIVWVRNQPFEVEPGPPQYDWFLIKNSNPQRMVSIVENDVLSFEEPASWSAGSTYHVTCDMDAQTGLLTITTDDGAGGTNTLQRPFEQSIVAYGNGLRLIWGWTEVNLDIVYPPWGWTFSNLVVDMEPGGPMGPLSVECPGNLDWVTNVLANGEVDVPYGPVALEASDGMGAHTFTVEDGSSLPPGLQLVGGALEGTPTSGGDYSFELRVTDDNAEYITRSFNLTVAGPAAGSESGAGDETSAGGSATAGSASSAGESGGGGSTGGGAGSASGASGSGAGGTGGESDALPAGFGGRDDGGCGCRAPAGGGARWWAVVLVLLARRRRWVSPAPSSPR